MNADKPETQVDRKERDVRLDNSTIVICVGFLVVFVSALADVLKFGSSVGFGWQQLIGCVIGGVLLVIGALIGAATLMVFGVITGLVAVLADLLHFGSSAGFGWQQLAGVIAGMLLTVVGVCIRLRRDR